MGGGWQQVSGLLPFAASHTPRTNAMTMTITNTRHQVFESGASDTPRRRGARPRPVQPHHRSGAGAHAPASAVLGHSFRRGVIRGNGFAPGINYLSVVYGPRLTPGAAEASALSRLQALVEGLWKCRPAHGLDRSGAHQRPSLAPESHLNRTFVADSEQIRADWRSSGPEQMTLRVRIALVGLARGRRIDCSALLALVCLWRRWR